MIQSFVLVFELDLPQEKVVLDVLLEHLLREVGLELVADDEGDLLKDLEEVSDHDLLATHGQADLLLYGGHIAAREQELVDIGNLSF